MKYHWPPSFVFFVQQPGVGGAATSWLAFVVSVGSVWRGGRSRPCLGQLLRQVAVRRWLSFPPLKLSKKKLHCPSAGLPGNYNPKLLEVQQLASRGRYQDFWVLNRELQKFCLAALKPLERERERERERTQTRGHCHTCVRPSSVSGAFCLLPTRFY